MKSIRKNLIWICLLLLAGGAQAQIAVKADTLHTMAGPTLYNAVVLMKDGKIESVGTADKVKIPNGYKVLHAAVVTPGLVDARSTAGLSGSLNIPVDQDQLEKSSPIQPDLRAIDAYNPEDTLVTYLRDWGITTMHTGHGEGALVSGQTMIVKTKPGYAEQVMVKPLSMLAMTLGSSVSSNFDSPGTSGKRMSMLRTELLKAKEYKKKKENKDETKRPATDLKMDMLVSLLDGQVKGLISANRLVDIMSAIRLSKEFGFKLVLEGCSECYRVPDEIKASGAEVIVHPTMKRNTGDMLNMTMENAALLTKAGIPVSIESGFEGYVPKNRVILFEAAVACGQAGLPYEEALKAITINPAKLLGIDNRVGSIEKGKDADLVLYTGDPFEYSTHVCAVVIDGKLVRDTCK